MFWFGILNVSLNHLSRYTIIVLCRAHVRIQIIDFGFFKGDAKKDEKSKKEEKAKKGMIMIHTNDHCFLI